MLAPPSAHPPLPRRTISRSGVAQHCGSDGPSVGLPTPDRKWSGGHLVRSMGSQPARSL